MLPNAANQDTREQPADDAPADSAPRGRIGLVALDERYLAAPSDLAAAGVAEANQRVEYGRQLVEDLAQNSPFLDERRLDEMLWNCLRETSLDSLVIGTRDGLTVAQATRGETGEILAIIGSLVEDTASRAEREAVVGSLDELVLKGEAGELVVVRYFPGTDRRFFLLAHARSRCAYRRGTNRIVRECGPLLASYAEM